MSCDLHTHSRFSDGTCSPGQLIEQAEKIGLKAIALTDHNSVSGLPEFWKAAEGKKVKAVPGAEFSTEYCGKELHMVGLFLPRSCWEAVTERMEDFRKTKDRSMVSLVEKLNQAGYCIDYQELRSRTPDGYVNRAHIAAELTRKGCTESISAAFSKLLNPGLGFYEPPRRPDVFETMAWIRSLGGVAVLAHPFLNLNETELREFLQKGKPDAMETVYTTYDAETTELAFRIASEYSLLCSGGSDFHGANKPDISIGTGRGNLHVPDEFYDRLKALADSRQ